MAKPNWPKIWLEIAEAYWTKPSERTERQKEIAFAGLCYATTFVKGTQNQASYPLKKLKSANIHSLNPDVRLGAGWWQWYGEDRYIRRAEFAEHMAGLSHEDFKNFIGGNYE